MNCFGKKNLLKAIKVFFVPVLAAVACLILLVACSGDRGDKILYGNGDEESKTMYPKSVDSSKTAKLAEGTAEIYIEAKAADVGVTFSGGSDIAASLKGSFETSDSGLQTELSIEENAGRITVSEKYSSQELKVKNNALTLEVEIPGTFKGKVRVKDISGDILYDCANSLKNDVSLENTSGGVEIRIPGDAGFVLENKTTTGKVYDDFNLDKTGGAVGDKKYNIAIKTVTGTIKITKI